MTSMQMIPESQPGAASCSGGPHAVPRQRSDRWADERGQARRSATVDGPVQDGGNQPLIRLVAAVAGEGLLTAAREQVRKVLDLSVARERHARCRSQRPCQLERELLVADGLVIDERCRRLWAGATSTSTAW
jgi:hypothetical protein